MIQRRRLLALALGLCAALAACGESGPERAPKPEATPKADGKVAPTRPAGDLVIARRETSKGGPRWRLWRVSPAGGAPRVFHEQLFPQHDPAIAPDGRSIAFVRPGRSGGPRGRGNFDVFVVSTLGGAPTRVTSSPQNEESPRWSPDGSFVVVTDAGFETSHVYVATTGADRDEWEVTSHPGIEVGGSWSPDSRRVLYSHGDLLRAFDLYWTDVLSGDVRRLTDTEEESELGAWGSPERSRTSPLPGRNRAGGYTSWAPTAGPPRLLARTDALAGVPTWSPDGKRVAWPLEFKRREYRIAILTVSEDPQTVDAEDAAVSGTEPVWAPDGAALAFLRDGNVWIAGADGASPRRLTRSPAQESIVGWLAAEGG